MTFAHRAKVGIGERRRQLNERARDGVNLSEQQRAFECEASDEPRCGTRERGWLGLDDEEQHAERLVEIEWTWQLAG